MATHRRHLSMSTPCPPPPSLAHDNPVMHTRPDGPGVSMNPALSEGLTAVGVEDADGHRCPSDVRSRGKGLMTPLPHRPGLVSQFFPQQCAIYSTQGHVRSNNYKQLRD
jgi:hypothetical protein